MGPRAIFWTWGAGAKYDILLKGTSSSFAKLVLLYNTEGGGEICNKDFWRIVNIFRVIKEKNSAL